MLDFYPPLAPAQAAEGGNIGASAELGPYLEYLRSIAPGYAGYIYLGSGQKKATIKRRVTTAARQLHRKLRFLRSSADELTFEVLGEE